jgi:hypothetical protein
MLHALNNLALILGWMVLVSVAILIGIAVVTVVLRALNNLALILGMRKPIKPPCKTCGGTEETPSDRDPDLMIPCAACLPIREWCRRMDQKADQIGAAMLIEQTRNVR